MRKIHLYITHLLLYTIILILTIFCWYC